MGGRIREDPHLTPRLRESNTPEFARPKPARPSRRQRRSAENRRPFRPAPGYAGIKGYWTLIQENGSRACLCDNRATGIAKRARESTVVVQPVIDDPAAIPAHAGINPSYSEAKKRPRRKPTMMERNAGTASGYFPLA